MREKDTSLSSQRSLSKVNVHGECFLQGQFQAKSTLLYTPSLMVTSQFFLLHKDELFSIALLAK